jgi:hypothetical protein
MEIREDGGHLLLRVWQKCYPKECDWGDAVVHLYVGNHGEKSIERDAHSGVAVYADRNPGEMVLLQLNGSQLAYRVFASYEEGGKRPSWDEIGLLSK